MSCLISLLLYWFLFFKGVKLFDFSNRLFCIPMILLYSVLFSVGMIKLFGFSIKLFCCPIISLNSILFTGGIIKSFGCSTKLLSNLNILLGFSILLFSDVIKLFLFFVNSFCCSIIVFGLVNSILPFLGKTKLLYCSIVLLVKLNAFSIGVFKLFCILVWFFWLLDKLILGNSILLISVNGKLFGCSIWIFCSGVKFILGNSILLSIGKIILFLFSVGFNDSLFVCKIKLFDCCIRLFSCPNLLLDILLANSILLLVGRIKLFLLFSILFCCWNTSPGYSIFLFEGIIKLLGFSNKLFCCSISLGKFNILFEFSIKLFVCPKIFGCPITSFWEFR